MEAIYQDRDQFAQLVREVASPDVGRMGIEILSFTIKDVFDNVEYLESLGRAQTANVKRDADVGVAEANRDAGIRVFWHFLDCFGAMILLEIDACNLWNLCLENLSSHEFCQMKKLLNIYFCS